MLAPFLVSSSEDTRAHRHMHSRGSRCPLCWTPSFWAGHHSLDIGRGTSGRRLCVCVLTHTVEYTAGPGFGGNGRFPEEVGEEE